ncbi:MAG TPA: hypothetical protein VHH11_01230 [Gammaproteobacteria bacterium]|jgi:hypothetical protein|nr:hypothetical protein [Gammaproteobacteria bacterium]
MLGLALTVLAGCSQPSAYESTANELSTTERGTPGMELAKAWKPIGRSFTDALSGEDQARREFWLSACISELTARYVPAPRDAVRALQLADCMQARGWRLAICDAGVDRCATPEGESLAPGARHRYSKKFAISGR